MKYTRIRTSFLTEWDLLYSNGLFTEARRSPPFMEIKNSLDDVEIDSDESEFEEVSSPEEDEEETLATSSHTRLRDDTSSSDDND